MACHCRLPAHWIHHLADPRLQLHLLALDDLAHELHVVAGHDFIAGESCDELIMQMQSRRSWH